MFMNVDKNDDAFTSAHWVCPNLKSETGFRFGGFLHLICECETAVLRKHEGRASSRAGLANGFSNRGLSNETAAKPANNKMPTRPT